MGTQDLENLRFECLCRTCMHEVAESVVTTGLITQETEQQWQSIFDIVAECGALRITELLHRTTPELIVQSNDDLPQKICRECLEQLLTVYKFQQMCLESDKEMRKFLKQDCLKKEISAPLETQETSENNVLALLMPTQLPQMTNAVAPQDPLQSSDNAVTLSEENFIKLELNDNSLSKDEQLETLTESLLDNAISVKADVLPSLLENSTAVKEHSSESDCDDIPLQIRKEKKLNVSTRENRKVKAQTSPIQQPADTDAISKTNSKPFVCTQCTKEFTSTSYLNRHLKRHQISTQSQNISPQPTVDTYTCDDCPRRFTKRDALYAHRQTHDQNIEVPGLNFSCDICSKNFNSRRNLIKHKHVHDENPSRKQYICEYCNKSFQQSSSLKDHLRTHTGEQPYLCSECGKAFNSSSNMKQHLLRHSGVKRYECPDCPKKFPCPSDLSSHRAVHCTIKPHICDLCGAAFGKPYQLKKHKMYHNGEKPHKCEYCQMRFVCTDHMRRHMRTHTGEKPYKCKYCERAFAQSNDLIKHLRSHLGENVYRCELCPSAFRLATDLRKHFTVHKNEDAETREKNMQALIEEDARFRIGMVYNQIPTQNTQTYPT